jgi:CRP-like cAMP-binding protein
MTQAKFKTYTRDQLQLIPVSEKYDLYSFEKKLTIYHEGKRPRFLYYLNKGKVKCVKMHEDGKEYITDLYNEGDFFGYSALIEDAHMTLPPLCSRRLRCCKFPGKNFYK